MCVPINSFIHDRNCAEFKGSSCQMTRIRVCKMAAQAVIQVLKTALWYKAGGESRLQRLFEHIHFFLGYGKRCYRFRLKSFEDYLWLIHRCYKL